MLRSTTILLALCLGACSQAIIDPPINTVAAAPLAPELSLATMKEVTATLSSDAFEGREPGTAGEEKTVSYLIEQFTAAGLEPGNDGSWTQQVPLVEITAKNIAPLAIGDMRFEHGPDWVGVTYREEAQTELADSEIVFVGYGINAPERGWNDYAGVDMRGKTALILVNDPDYMIEGLDGPFNGRAMTYYGRWTYKYEEAARQGAAAAIIIHEDFPASYGWKVVESSWSGPQAYAAREDGGADQTQVNAWLHLDAAKQIIEAAGHDFAQITHLASHEGFRAVPLGISASTQFENDFRRFNSANVIGILPGNDRPEEYVLNTAHWDHLGRCTPNDAGDDICNGAVDNATGTAALVALAKAHKQAGGTERTQIFLAVTAEEAGLLGSEYYGSDPVFPLSQTVGGVNMDALYPTSEARDVTVIGGGKSELDAYLTRALAQQNLEATPDASPQAGRYYRSDHFSLAKRGVPMFYIKAGEDLLEGGREAGHAAYIAYNKDAYHGPDDEYNANWEWGAIMQNLRLYYSLGEMLGNSDDWPNWYENDEFRAVRDQSCSGDGADNSAGC